MYNNFYNVTFCVDNTKLLCTKNFRLRCNYNLRFTNVMSDGDIQGFVRNNIPWMLIY